MIREGPQPVRPRIDGREFGGQGVHGIAVRCGRVQEPAALLVGACNVPAVSSRSRIRRMPTQTGRHPPEPRRPPGHARCPAGTSPRRQRTTAHGKSAPDRIHHGWRPSRHEPDPAADPRENPAPLDRRSPYGTQAGRTERCGTPRAGSPPSFHLPVEAITRTGISEAGFIVCPDSSRYRGFADDLGRSRLDL